MVTTSTSALHEGRAVAVIGDIVGSRRLVARSDGQRVLLDALARVNDVVPSMSSLAPTVGDEFQGLYRSESAALRATLLVRLELADAFDTRFGIGAGISEKVPSGDVTLQNGTAWWSARDAILAAKRRETGRNPNLRTWYLGDEEAADPRLINAYLLARDHLVTAMDARSRRLMRGAMQGLTQVELATSEGITQSAVSRNLQRNGAFAVIDGAGLLEKGVVER
jgi:hypothetical protein